ncbi:MAG: flavodoxin family protein [Treponema sp.]|nr:flavodoxin family protein [Treponema sp.]
MKVLALNGSPRKNGSIEKILREITIGTDCDFVDVHQLNFDGCHGCMSCRSKGSCILKGDDAHIIAEKVKAADIVVIGSPCYWANMNGKLKMLFDRIVYVMMSESKSGIPVSLNKGKKCIIATACTTPYPFNLLAGQSSGTIRAIKEITKYSGFSCIGVIQKAGTKESRDLTKGELEKCRKLNLKLKKIIKKGI